MIINVAITEFFIYNSIWFNIK